MQRHEHRVSNIDREVDDLRLEIVQKLKQEQDEHEWIMQKQLKEYE